jgi:hypothetical protein
LARLVPVPALSLTVCVPTVVSNGPLLPPQGTSVPFATGDPSSNRLKRPGSLSGSHNFVTVSRGGGRVATKHSAVASVCTAGEYWAMSLGVYSARKQY